MPEPPAVDTPTASKRRMVVKLGTSVLTGGTRRLDRSRMVELVRQCAALRDDGVEIVLCSSGAIGAGRERLGFEDPPRSLSEKQMLAAVGQSRLMETWEGLFDIYGIHVGQMLLTRGDVEDRHRFLNARDTLQALVGHGIVPIVNENDAIATEEIKVGDNDVLSALCVLLADADLLAILTDQEGLYTSDPRTDPDAELIREVDEIDDDLRAAAGGAGALGTGGMKTKLEAAEIARRAGAEVVIASGSAPDILLRIAAGEAVGTRFPALEAPLEDRKRWIFGGAVSGARIVVDEGAREALRERCGSLLPAGVVRVEGDFERGDVVRIAGPDGGALGRGVVRYGSNETRRIRGCHSERIAEVLGYASGSVVVHRDDLILV